MRKDQSTADVRLGVTRPSEVPILLDNPAANAALFDRQIDMATDIITSHAADGLTMAIYGAWGSGRGIGPSGQTTPLSRRVAEYGAYGINPGAKAGSPSARPFELFMNRNSFSCQWYEGDIPIVGEFCESYERSPTYKEEES